MIFNPNTDETTAIIKENAEEVERRAYLLGLERAWFLYIRAERQHPVFTLKRAGVKYAGYPTLNAYLSAMNAQNQILRDALDVLAGIREELYGCWFHGEAA